MSTYYNENDPKKVAMLKALMEDGHISQGDIDDRSIKEVQADDVKGYTRYHFFAGIGVWDYALTLAGWPEEEPVWTGSCPCGPWSIASTVWGRQKAEADERDLWPDWSNLVTGDVPVFGEQVSTEVALRWYDRMADDMEAKDYTVRALDLPAVCAGASQRRYRILFAANPRGKRMERPLTPGSVGETGQRGWRGQEDLRLVASDPFAATERYPQPLIRPVDDGCPGDVAIVHAAGDAIDAHLAAGFIRETAKQWML